MHCSIQCKYTFVDLSQYHWRLPDSETSTDSCSTPTLFFFKHITLFPVCWYIWHMSGLEVSGVPLTWKSSMWAWKSFVFSCWIAISVRSNLLTVLFKCSLELLDFICCVYQLPTEVYKCSTFVGDFSISPCGLLSFCFNVLMLRYKVMTA